MSLFEIIIITIGIVNLILDIVKLSHEKEKK